MQGRENTGPRSMNNHPRNPGTNPDIMSGFFLVLAEFEVSGHESGHRVRIQSPSRHSSRQNGQGGGPKSRIPRYPAAFPANLPDFPVARAGNGNSRHFSCQNGSTAGAGERPTSPEQEQVRAPRKRTSVVITRTSINTRSIMRPIMTSTTTPMTMTTLRTNTNPTTIETDQSAVVPQGWTKVEARDLSSGTRRAEEETDKTLRAIQKTSGV